MTETVNRPSISGMKGNIVGDPFAATLTRRGPTVDRELLHQAIICPWCRQTRAEESHENPRIVTL